MADTRVLVVPGGTSDRAVATSYAALHELVDRHEERLGGAGHGPDLVPGPVPGPDPDTDPDPDPDPERPGTRTVVALTDPAALARLALRSPTATAAEAFPGLDRAIASDPHLLDGIDLVVATSGSSTGRPRLVGLSADAMVASARSTERALEGPGSWVLALPAHHIGGAQVLFRSALAGASPLVVDTTGGFRPEDLIPAIKGATADHDVPGYLSMVPTQLSTCLEAGPRVAAALSRLTAVLVGGSGVDPVLLERARRRGIAVHTTYGMTETAGGCVYDGIPLPGVVVRTVEIEGRPRLAIAGPMLMTRYLEGESPFIDEAGLRWLLTGDLGQITPAGSVEVLGRSDEVIVSGGLSIAPAPVRRAVLSTPGVAAAWILGLPDERWGSVLTAAIVPEPATGVRTDLALPPVGIDEGGPVLVPDDAGAEGTVLTAVAPTVAAEDGPSPELVELAAAIRDHVGEALGRVNAPRVVVALDELPLLPSGKVDRRAVRAAVGERIGTSTEWRR